MGMHGVGFMLSQLYGNSDSVDAFKAAIGKTIKAARADDDSLYLTFTDDSGIRFYDDGQLCCESRYMRTDDDVASFAGSVLTGAEIKDGPDEEGEYGDAHEVQFLEVQTSTGVITMSSHNEHNGYYGGISLRVEPVK